MNKNLLVGLCAIVIVLGIGYALTQPKQAAAPEEGAPDTVGSEVTSDTSDAGAAGGTMLAGEVLPDTWTVTYDGSNFNPETITIIEGGTVRFVNESDEPMWVGSDDHPSHKLYPITSGNDCLGSSFDQCAATGKGSEWSYTFTEVGTWGYHNHRKARSGGNVVVVTEAEYLSTH